MWQPKMSVSGENVQRSRSSTPSFHTIPNSSATVNVYIMSIACEHNGCVEALSPMRRDAEVAPKMSVKITCDEK